MAPKLRRLASAWLPRRWWRIAPPADRAVLAALLIALATAGLIVERGLATGALATAITPTYHIHP